jgi:hypothetical protein
MPEVLLPEGRGANRLEAWNEDTTNKQSEVHLYCTETGLSFLSLVVDVYVFFHPLARQERWRGREKPPCRQILL